jgi:predicted MFS family arabinose efflux permease
MVLSGSVLTVLGIMMLSLSTTYYQIFLSQGICVGVGCGLLYVPSLALVGASFKANRAFAIGVVTCGIAVGGIVYTIAFSQLIPMLGFGWTIRVLGFITLTLFVLSFPCLLLRKSSSVSTPGGPRRLLDLSAFRNASFIVFCTTTFFTFLGYIVPFFYMPAFAQQGLHTSQSLGLYGLVVSQATSLVGRLAAAYGAHRFGGVLTWIVGSLLSGLLCFCWIAVESIGGFFAFCALYGK